MRYKIGDLLHVTNDVLDFYCTVLEVEVEDPNDMDYEGCKGLYKCRWEGPINPDVELEIILWEFTDDRICASEDSDAGFEFQDVEVVEVMK